MLVEEMEKCQGESKLNLVVANTASECQSRSGQE